MGLRRRALAILVMLATTFGTARPTTAQDAPAAPSPPADNYAQLVEAALRAHAAGDNQRAFELFRQAHAIHPNARTLRGLGVTSFAAGDPVKAIDYLEAALVHPERPLDDKLRAAVHELLERAHHLVASYRFEVQPVDAAVAMDGGVMRPTQGLTLSVLPGTHSFVFSAPGHVDQTVQVDAMGGAREVVRIELVAAPVVPAVTDAEATPPALAEARPAVLTPRPTHPLTPPRRLVRAKWATLGAGGALLVASGVIAGVGFYNRHAIEKECGPGECSRAHLQHEAKAAHLSQLALAFDVVAASAALPLGAALGFWLYERRSYAQETSAGLQFKARF
jgi:hypothetical protein